MTDWDTPSLTDEYSDFRDFLKEQLDHLGKEDFTSDTNIPVGFFRTNSTSFKKEQYTGSSWALTSRELDIDNHINNSTLHQGAPAGSIIAWLTSTPPTGWVLLDGVAKSRTTYAALFAEWGTTFGAGDGSTTFGVPDCRSMVLIGKGGSGSANAPLGSTFGTIDHVHTGPSHTHAVASHTHTMANHTHNGAAHTHSTPNHQHTVQAHYHAATGNGATIAISSGGAHAHGVPTRNNASGFSNSGTAFGKVTPAWAGGYDLNTESAGAHIHSNADFAGHVGNVNSGNSGDGGVLTNSTGGSTTGSSGTGATSAPSTNTTDGTTLTTDAGGTGNTGTANMPCVIINWIAKGV